MNECVNLGKILKDGNFVSIRDMFPIDHDICEGSPYLEVDSGNEDMYYVYFPSSEIGPTVHVYTKVSSVSPEIICVQRKATILEDRVYKNENSHYNSLFFANAKEDGVKFPICYLYGQDIYEADDKPIELSPFGYTLAYTRTHEHGGYDVVLYSSDKKRDFVRIFNVSGLRYFPGYILLYKCIKGHTEAGAIVIDLIHERYYNFGGYYEASDSQLLDLSAIIKARDFNGKYMELLVDDKGSRIVFARTISSDKKDSCIATLYGPNDTVGRNGEIIDLNDNKFSKKLEEINFFTQK